MDDRSIFLLLGPMSFSYVTETAQYIERLLCFEPTDRLITLIVLAFPAILALKQREVVDLVIVIVLQREI